MNNTLRTALVVFAVLAIAGGIFFSGVIVGGMGGLGPFGMMGSYRNGYYGSGMMNGQGNNGAYDMMDGYGPGMMNRRGGNNGNGMMGGQGMMGNYGNTNNAAPLTVEQAKTAAEAYIKTLGVAGLQVSEVMVFDNNAYVVVKETANGSGAFELLVDPVSQTAYPEFGPNMMWNLKYGGLNHSQMMGGNNGMMKNMMGNMMGGDGWDTTTPSDLSAPMSVTPEKAIEYAQKYLDANIKGATAATDPVQFYGYYTLDFEKDGKVAGMLSVNGFSGQVFLHTWHGTFIEESEIK